MAAFAHNISRVNPRSKTVKKFYVRINDRDAQGKELPEHWKSADVFKSSGMGGWEMYPHHIGKIDDYQFGVEAERQKLLKQGYIEVNSKENPRGYPKRKQWSGLTFEQEQSRKEWHRELDEKRNRDFEEFKEAKSLGYFLPMPSERSFSYEEQMNKLREFIRANKHRAGWSAEDDALWAENPKRGQIYDDLPSFEYVPQTIHSHTINAYPIKAELGGGYRGMIVNKLTKVVTKSDVLKTLSEATYWAKKAAHDAIPSGAYSLAPVRSKGEYKAFVWVDGQTGLAEIKNPMRRKNPAYAIHLTRWPTNTNRVQQETRIPFDGSIEKAKEKGLREAREQLKGVDASGKSTARAVEIVVSDSGYPDSGDMLYSYELTHENQYSSRPKWHKFANRHHNPDPLEPEREYRNEKSIIYVTGERRDGTLAVRFVYPGSFVKKNKIITKEKLEEYRATGSYNIYRKNPEEGDEPEVMDSPDEAAALYEEFHGVPSEQTEEYVTEEFERTNFAGLGQLCELIVTLISTGKEATITASEEETEKVQLASSPDGRQLFFIGGDQSLDLDALGFEQDDTRDHMLIGVITELTYRTKKTMHKLKLTEYFHGLGEESGNQPMLEYKPLSKSLSIIGGSYHVEPEGITD